MKIQPDLLEGIAIFQNANSPNHRYISFDYCYNYFLTNKGSKLTKDIEKSSLVLGFYLASWGMMRGSSFLLQKSCKYYEPLIIYISTLDESVWSIDVDSYDTDNIQKICDIYTNIKSIIIVGRSSDLTLITKIMLGVFGFIPAFDQFFTNSFRAMYGDQCGFRRINPKALFLIQDFYFSNKDQIDELSHSTYTIDFASGLNTNTHYTKAKIIDMYGFTKGIGTLQR
jgi:hypothetical protein